MMSLTELATALRTFTYRQECEDTLQQGVALALDVWGILYHREARLSDGARIDFWLPLEQIGIEVKVDGSALTVTRQLLRYARTKPKGLILLTSRMRHRNVPATLAGVAIETVCVTEGAL